MLQINNICFSYEAPVLKNASFTFSENEITQIHGGNGAGKTSLFRVIGGVLRADAGEVLWRGSCIDRSAIRVVYLGTSSQSIFPRLTGAQNLEFFGALYGIGAREVVAAANSLNAFSLNFLPHPLETLSQGMLQKFLWIRALSVDPDLLLLDESMNSLDKAAKEIAITQLAEFSRRGKVVIVSQHDRRVGSRHLVLQSGGLIEEV